MPTLSSSDRTTNRSLVPAITTSVVILALYFGEAIIVPFAFALLLTFLLSAPVTWLERLRVPRSFAVPVVLAVAVLSAAALMWVGVEQLTGVLRSLPDYRANIVRKLERLRNLGGQGVVGTVQRLDELKAQVDTNRLKSETNDTSGTSRNRKTRTTDKIERAPVEVAKPGSTFLPSIGLIGTSVMHYVAMAGAVV